MINNTVKEVVEKKDVSGARSTLSMMAYMANSDSHEDFKDSVRFAEKNIIELYEIDDDIEYSEEDITSDNYISIAKLLTNNFSKKKCNSIFRIGDKLFSQDIENDKEGTGDSRDFFPKMAICIVGAVIVIGVVAVIVKSLIK